MELFQWNQAMKYFAVFTLPAIVLTSSVTFSTTGQLWRPLMYKRFGFTSQNNANMMSHDLMWKLSVPCNHPNFEHVKKCLKRKEPHMLLALNLKSPCLQKNPIIVRLHAISPSTKSKWENGKRKD